MLPEADDFGNEPKVVDAAGIANGSSENGSVANAAVLLKTIDKSHAISNLIVYLEKMLFC